VTDAWLDRLAERLGVDALGADERSRVLAAARDVAHGVERRLTPLATFLLGAAVARRLSEGEARHDAVRAAVEELESLIPDAQPDELP
jgi:Domain of unknown function (DUF6457)